MGDNKVYINVRSVTDEELEAITWFKNKYGINTNTKAVLEAISNYKKLYTELESLKLDYDILKESTRRLKQENLKLLGS